MLKHYFKIGALILAVLMIVSVASCSGKQSETKDKPSSSSKAASSRTKSEIDKSEPSLSDSSTLIDDEYSSSSDDESQGGSSLNPVIEDKKEPIIGYRAGSTPEGDTSFKINTTGLAKNTIYMIDMKVIKAAYDIMEHDAARLVTSLQGLINRDFDRNKIAIFINRNSTDTFWLDYLDGSGKMLDGMTKVSVTSFDQFLDVFKNQLVSCGMIIWDPNVASTANVAGTICGLDGYLPVKYDTKSTSIHQRLKAMGVAEKISLVAKFKGKGKISGTNIDSTGSRKCDAYIWAMEKYMYRCSNKYIAYVPDGAGAVKTNVIYINDGDSRTAEGNIIYNHDYYIARRCFFYDLNPVFETTCDEPEQPVGTDFLTLRKLINTRYALAGGNIGQNIGFPPWWLKYTSHNNWGSLEGTVVEWMYVEMLSKYNLAIEADAAQPACLSNASIYYKYPLKSQYTNNKPASYLKFDPNKLYCLVFLGDYDSSAWLAQHVPNMWADPNKGNLPNMWSFNTNLSDRVPMVFDYIYENKQQNDYFATGNSGAGYVMPTALFQEEGFRSLPSGDQLWADYSRSFMNRFQVDITGFIINGYFPIDEKVMGLFNKISPAGNMHSDSTKPLTIYKGTPYVYLTTGLGTTTMATNERVDRIYDSWLNKMNKGNFISFRTVVNTPTDIKTLTDAFVQRMKEKAPEKEVVFVDPYNFFNLVKESGKATVIN